VIPESVMESAKLKADTMAHIFSHIGVDAVTLGEKDLALGVPFLKELEKKWNFPFVSANLTDENGSLIFKKYVLKEVNGKNVAILGLMGDTSEMIDKVEEATGGTVKVTDPLEAASAIIEELSGKVDYTIVLAHQKTNRDWVLARRVKGIDLIIGGQDTLKTEEPAKASTRDFWRSHLTVMERKHPRILLFHIARMWKTIPKLKQC
jgi:5'-nucleotidase/UDP-sugar diphosphatase